MRSIAAATAMIAFLWPRRGLRLKYRALRLEFTLIAARAACTSPGLSQGAPLRRRLERFRPALSSSLAHRPAKGDQMVVRGESVHVDADLGEHGLGDVVGEAGNILQPLGGVEKRGERGLDPRVELGDRGFDLFDRSDADRSGSDDGRASVRRALRQLRRGCRRAFKGGRVRPAVADRFGRTRSPSRCVGP